MCHQGGLCSVAIRGMPLKASFRFMCSSLLQQDRTIPQEAWFTIPSPCFYRAWLCKWSWWRPQPRVTESSGTTADLQRHSVILVSSQRVPGGDSLRLRLSSTRPLPSTSGKHFPPRSPTSLSTDLTVQEALEGSSDSWWGHSSRVQESHLWGSSWGLTGREGGDWGKREKKKWLWILLVRFFTANHTQDWFTAHSALFPHFSYHTFHCPISQFCQGQMKGMMACMPHWDLL